MQEFSISLLRERFIIHDPKLEGSAKDAVTALSNRILLELKNKDGDIRERFVIRTQNMHSCVRMTMKIFQEFSKLGPLLGRANEFNWQAAWDSIINDYEYAFNPQRWVSIYHEGSPVYTKGEHHPLLDLIEKCTAEHKGEYEEAIGLAEKAFQNKGEKTKIEYDGNVALVVNLEETHGRCGIILRGADRTTTFNFSAASQGDKTLNFVQCTNAAAAFLEGIQLAFQVGMDNIKIMWGIIPRLSKEEKKNREAQKRLSRLSTEIANLENAFKVNYRPERPEFHHIVVEAEGIAKGLFERRN